MTAVSVQLTGPVRIVQDMGVLTESELPGRHGRIVLARLALSSAPLHRDTLAHDLWPDRLPSTRKRTLAGVLSRLSVDDAYRRAMRIDVIRTKASS